MKLLACLTYIILILLPYLRNFEDDNYHGILVPVDNSTTTFRTILCGCRLRMTPHPLATRTKTCSFRLYLTKWIR